MNQICDRQNQLDQLISTIRSVRIQPDTGFNAFLATKGSSPITEAQSADLLLKRPELSVDELLPYFNVSDDQLDPETLQRAGIEIKYEGYISRQQGEIERQTRLENSLIPDDFDYSGLQGITGEAREKLSRMKPASLGQASRIAGVTPADISVLSIYLHGLLQ